MKLEFFHERQTSLITFSGLNQYNFDKPEEDVLPKSVNLSLEKRIKNVILYFSQKKLILKILSRTR